MTGHSRPHLLLGGDRHLYVVKLMDSPNPAVMLAKELLAASLARVIGLPAAEPVVMQVPKALNPVSRLPGSAGTGQLHYGSRYVGDSARSPWDWVPWSQFHRVRRARDLWGALVFDKWVGNSSYRQVAFWKRPKAGRYDLALIDFDQCFNWEPAAASPRAGAYPDLDVYSAVTGWDCFEPWLSRIETITLETISTCADAVPTEWAGREVVAKLATKLVENRLEVRNLIQQFRLANPASCRAWR